MAARGKQVLKLYKELLREAGKFPGYMYRTYSLRRIKDAFKEHKTELNGEKIDELLSYGRSNLDIIKRQVVIGHLYGEPMSVIEKHLDSGKVQPRKT